LLNYVNIELLEWLFLIGSPRLLGGAIIGYFILENHSVALWTMWLIVWILIGIVIHLLVGVDTMLGYYLGLNKKPRCVVEKRK